MTTLATPWDRPPLSLNDRYGNWAHRAAATRKVRDTVYVLARQAALAPTDHVTVTLVWTVPDKRRRDTDNPIATLKAACDALVLAGVVKDDTPEYMTKHMPVIEYVKGVKGVRIEIVDSRIADDVHQLTDTNG